MKRIIYSSIALIVLFSCKSVEKLVEKGDYDGAIHLAAKELRSQDEPKTKDVKALETAFKRVMQKDLSEIEYLRSGNNDSNWGRIYSTYQRIRNRQETITPFLPLISKDGYAAHFQFINVNPLLEEAAENAATYHYDEARKFLEMAERGDKWQAREAYEELETIERYYRSYRDADKLKEKAHDLGIHRIHVTARNTSESIMPAFMQDELENMNIAEMDGFWQKFYTRNVPGIEMDYRAILEIHTIYISPEREKETIYFDDKEIRDGYRYVLDKNGNVVKDSLGNDVKEPNYVIARAEVSELFREKIALVQGKLKLIDLFTEEVVSDKPVESEVVFSSYATSYRGDERALKSRSRRYLRSHPEPFPTDYELLMTAADEIKHSVGDYLRHSSL